MTGNRRFTVTVGALHTSNTTMCDDASEYSTHFDNSAPGGDKALCVVIVSIYRSSLCSLASGNNLSLIKLMYSVVQ